MCINIIAIGVRRHRVVVYIHSSNANESDEVVFFHVLCKVLASRTREFPAIAHK
jgi:hypothetical protein